MQLFQTGIWVVLSTRTPQTTESEFYFSVLVAIGDYKTQFSFSDSFAFQWSWKGTQEVWKRCFQKNGFVLFKILEGRWSRSQNADRTNYPDATSLLAIRFRLSGLLATAILALVVISLILLSFAEQVHDIRHKVARLPTHEPTQTSTQTARWKRKIQFHLNCSNTYRVFLMCHGSFDGVLKHLHHIGTIGSRHKEKRHLQRMMKKYRTKNECRVYKVSGNSNKFRSSQFRA